jgi:hypothetical protein
MNLLPLLFIQKMSVLERRRTVPAGKSSVEREVLLDSIQLAGIMHGILDGKPH